MPDESRSRLPWGRSARGSGPRLILALLVGCATKAPTTESPPSDGTTADATSHDAAVVESAGIQFVDVSARLGLEPVRARGVALLDFDDDGWPDITIAEHDGVRLLRNQQGGGFAPVALPAGPVGAHGVTWADVNDDGKRDLFVTVRGNANRLLLASADGFIDGTAQAGLAGLADLDNPSAEGASFADLDRDGDLDLYLCQGADGRVVGSFGYQGRPDVVFRNDGGHFTDVTQAWGFGLRPDGETFMAILVDLDDDARTDAFIVDDHRDDLLLLGPELAGGAFVNRSKERLKVDPSSIMGVDVADIDGDGLLDLYSTTASADRLYVRPDGIAFEDVRSVWMDRGTDASANTVGWGVGLVDLELDGDLDVVTAASYSDLTDAERGVVRPGLLAAYRHDGTGPQQRLVDVSATSGPSFESSTNAWGLALGDIDRDGDLDMLVGVDRDLEVSAIPVGDTPIRHVLLLENRTPRQLPDQMANGWIAVRLRQPGQNHFAVGADVTLQQNAFVSRRPILAGSSYISHHDDALHFGLGPRDGVAWLDVRWPDGQHTVYLEVPGGEHTLTRQAGATCCIIGGACDAAGKEACLGKLRQRLPASSPCHAVCRRLDECGDRGGRAQCLSECATDPLDKPTVACVQRATCADLEKCLPSEER